MSRKKSDGPSPKNPKKTRTITHRLGAHYIGDDDVEREIELSRLDDNCLVLIFTTWWEGKEVTPMETRIVLKHQTFNMMLAIIGEYQENRNRYKVPTSAGEGEA
jgi:hypothetical protein